MMEFIQEFALVFFIIAFIPFLLSIEFLMKQTSIDCEVIFIVSFKIPFEILF